MHNHILQVIALARDEAPRSRGTGAFSDTKAALPRSIGPLDSAHAVRGQYRGYAIKARYSAAEVYANISEAATGVGEQMSAVALAMQRAIDKTENMKARADAVSGLEAAGTFEDFTQLGAGQDDIDRQLSQITSASEVDSALAKMKAQVGPGAPSQQLPGGGESETGS